MSKHTPGPWMVEGPNKSYARDTYSLYTGTEVKPHWFADIQFMNKQYEEGEANARLIARRQGLVRALPNYKAAIKLV